MITLTFEKKSPGFLLNDGGRSFRLDFISAPVDSCISIAKDSACYWVRNGVRATIFQEQSGVVVLFSRESMFPCTFKMRFSDVDSVGEKSVLVQDIEYVVETQDGEFSLEEGIVTMPGMMMRVDIRLASEVGAGIFAIDTSQETWQPFTRVPEFSVGVFDDPSFEIPRPLRHGVPVVSTLPTEAKNQTDAQLLEEGLGEEKRTMYFRIICNRILETLTAGDLSACKLKIYLPSGLDTVGSPISVPMYYVGTDNSLESGTYLTPSQSVYRAKYTFHKEDTVCYVDGFFYLSVYAPITVQQALPFIFGIA